MICQIAINRRYTLSREQLKNTGSAKTWTVEGMPVYFAAMHRVKWVWALVAGLICVGCAKVQRTMSIDSDPEGALVYMNDQEIGRTPVTRDFIWYGWYDITLRKDGYKTLTTRAQVIAPAWQWPPFDLVAEFSPARLKDIHRLSFKLEPPGEQPTTDEMLGRAEQLRVQLQSSENTKNPSTRPVTQPATTQFTEPSTTQSTTGPATTQSTQPSTEPTTKPAVPAPTTQPTTQNRFL
jgi:PEGA domain